MGKKQQRGYYRICFLETTRPVTFPANYDEKILVVGLALTNLEIKQISATMEKRLML